MATRQQDIATIGKPGFDAARGVRAGFSRTLTRFDSLTLGGATPR